MLRTTEKVDSDIDGGDDGDEQQEEGGRDGTRRGGLARIKYQSQPSVDISRENFVVWICRIERQH